MDEEGLVLEKRGWLFFFFTSAAPSSRPSLFLYEMPVSPHNPRFMSREKQIASSLRRIQYNHASRATSHVLHHQV